MPQMAPINWMVLFIFFIMCFLMFNVMNYFNFSPKMKFNKKNNIINKKMNWKW